MNFSGSRWHSRHHLERLGLHHQRHSIHAAVTARATDSLGDVDCVVEVDVIGQVVDPRPLDRGLGPVALANRLEHLAVVPDQLVTVHAGGCGRHAGECRFLDRGMAIEAADAQPGDMVIVAEWDGLSADDRLSSGVGRAIEDHEHPDQDRDEEDTTEEAHFGQGVGAGPKDLRHLVVEVSPVGDAFLLLPGKESGALASAPLRASEWPRKVAKEYLGSGLCQGAGEVEPIRMPWIRGGSG